MSDLLLRRRAMMEVGEPELYPIGTDIVAKYIGFLPGSTTKKNFVTPAVIKAADGEYVESGSGAASPVYMEIRPEYRYHKTSAGRIYMLAYYDKDKVFISSIVSNNLNEVDLPAPPENAKYARIQTHQLQNNWGVGIIRIE